jgi:hypothetical protein
MFTARPPTVDTRRVSPGVEIFPPGSLPPQCLQGDSGRCCSTSADDLPEVWWIVQFSWCPPPNVEKSGTWYHLLRRPSGGFTPDLFGIHQPLENSRRTGVFFQVPRHVTEGSKSRVINVPILRLPDRVRRLVCERLARDTRHHGRHVVFPVTE